MDRKEVDINVILMLVTSVNSSEYAECSIIIESLKQVRQAYKYKVRDKTYELL